MNAHLFLVTTFMTVFLLSKCDAQGACPSGWFGHLCMYRCHCMISSSCSLTDGSCPLGDKCDLLYFGPGCQYYDLASELLRQAYYNDGDDNTCNENNVTTVEPFYWNRLITFQWLRLVVKTPHILRNFSLILNRNVECANQRTYPVHDKAVDVICSNRIPISMIEVTGPAVFSICTFQVTAGRNVALKQPTSQSSPFAYFPQPELGQSSNAVDGNADPELNHSSCAHTAFERNPWWNLQFRRSYNLDMLYIYNRNSFANMLSHFEARTYNGNQTTNVFIDTERDVKHLYQLNLLSPQPSTSIRISLRNECLLAVCEVEAYGEVACPDGKYGLECQYNCTCSLNESCSIATGACSNPCPQGTYGFKCAENCSSRCVNNSCMERSGRCFSCHPGYMGDYCTEKCEQGWYGANCSQTCSIHCGKKACSVKTGQCAPCKNNRTGPLCEDCKLGMFGFNCTRPCPVLCAGNRCNVDTGKCLSCAADRTGPLCQDCPVGYYGDVCAQRCSGNCVNNKCHVVSGACFACVGDYTGAYCNISERLVESVAQSIKPRAPATTPINQR